MKILNKITKLKLISKEKNFVDKCDKGKKYFKSKRKKNKKQKENTLLYLLK